MLLGIIIIAWSLILTCICNNGIYLTRSVAKLIFYDEEVDKLTSEEDNNTNKTEKYISNTLVTLYQNGLEKVSTKDLIEMSLMENESLSEEIAKSVEEVKSEPVENKNATDIEIIEPCEKSEVDNTSEIIID